MRHAELPRTAAPGAAMWIEAGMGHAEHAATPELVHHVVAWLRTIRAATPAAGLPRLPR